MLENSLGSNRLYGFFLTWSLMPGITLMVLVMAAAMQSATSRSVVPPITVALPRIDPETICFFPATNLEGFDRSPVSLDVTVGWAWGVPKTIALSVALKSYCLADPA